MSDDLRLYFDDKTEKKIRKESGPTKKFDKDIHSSRHGIELKDGST